ncbi:hypothetical protein BGV40_15615 [Methanosarcina sp. Ant1]|nr:hypothetical protein BGV40_15615 [Methanosarcina sp. Ant1]
MKILPKIVLLSAAKRTSCSRSEIREVEQLMGLCDELEAKLRKAREDGEKLIEMVVRGLLEGVII